MADLQKSSADKETVEGVSLLDQVMQETRLKPGDDGFDTARQGVQAFIADLVAPNRRSGKVEQKLVDDMISEVDQKISAQLDEIIHAEPFRKLESSWRGLKFLVDRTDFRENIRIEVISMSKEELLEDFEDAPDTTKSGLYKHVYSAEYGQFGGKPIGSIITGYDFGPNSQDVKLLGDLASVAAMAHAPVVANAGPEFFGLDEFSGLPNLKDLESIFEGPQYAKWHGFRESDDSRNIGLTVPRFMLRSAYGENNKVKAFNYQENIGKDFNKLCWGAASYAFAGNLTRSFAKYRWCPNIIGPQSGGEVLDLPVYNYEESGDIRAYTPTEVMITDRQEFELAEQGFMGLVARKGTDNATFFSANSCQKPKFFGNTPEGKQAETNFKLGTELPYLFMVDRLAHYIKVLQREHIGSWKTKNDLDRELNGWIRQYVADQDNPPPEVRSRKPLREAQIIVTDDEGNPGFYRVEMNVRPHFKYMGSSFTLSLAGKLDKE
ncbi:type VI secretion system contractile sheath large subunit [Saccharospirillum alexandrii]|uniref:type VI secretion system contractile sheath large subunit n=1 Tax=Saccharospirillum alexandrii TaxID=2448477 RepID=UPI000FDB85BD|nr:type VI secretion system contractile sheath large subunit [Saccharospirillum alexandrii]